MGALVPIYYDIRCPPPPHTHTALDSATDSMHMFEVKDRDQLISISIVGYNLSVRATVSDL